MGDKQIEKNSWTVLGYLEVWHCIEPSVGQNEMPYDRKAKPGSRSPCSENALDVIDANAQAASRIDAILEDLAGTAYGGVVKHLRQDPGAVANWRARQSREWRALRGLCRIVAMRLARSYDGPGGPYVLPPVKLGKRSVAQALRNPNRDSPPGKARTYTAEHSYRVISEQIDDLISQGYSEAAARGYLMDRGVSGPRISRARRFVREERGEVA